ncbi:uncharacterized protein PHALS_11496 [Plasmopara halstedii]|uniref:Uncharacterized protein n=1 Tax=Plasmopara halstedii TaxID=4781 RepID=A0A0P1A5U9_PLAHL|nr:uncharacterized protein PHALS_11496 [Plasmopara halstedii]CEG35625.1 hypothetical protein PHALS_11496 [Plasmopara halstedii]|eukprot:XP_024571994.1 hypothetical protein PHALS_11496 [Plasmopara halstedii]
MNKSKKNDQIADVWTWSYLSSVAGKKPDNEVAICGRLRPHDLNIESGPASETWDMMPHRTLCGQKLLRRANNA